MIKKVLPWFVFVLFAALLIIAYALKDKMNNYTAELIKQQASPEIISSGEALIDSLYNYSENGLDYSFTFLEFGAKGCTACKRMEKVMEQIRSEYPNRVNVVFNNVLKADQQNLMKMYGIATIPTQILLDKNGKEIFRHTGYISSPELSLHFLKSI